MRCPLPLELDIFPSFWKIVFELEFTFQLRYYN